MKDIDWERLVVVTAVHGERCLGWVPQEPNLDPKKYLEERGQAGLPIKLQDVRNLVSQTTPSVDTRGNIVGLSKMLMLLPIDLFNGPLRELHVIPSSWYFPGDNSDDCKKQVVDLIEQAVETETRLSATAAGLHLVGGPLPPPRKTP